MQCLDIHLKQCRGVRINSKEVGFSFYFTWGCFIWVMLETSINLFLAFFIKLLIKTLILSQSYCLEMWSSWRIAGVWSCAKPMKWRFSYSHLSNRIDYLYYISGILDTHFLFVRSFLHSSTLPFLIIFKNIRPILEVVILMFLLSCHSCNRMHSFLNIQLITIFYTVRQKKQPLHYKINNLSFFCLTV